MPAWRLPLSAELGMGPDVRLGLPICWLGLDIALGTFGRAGDLSAAACCLMPAKDPGSGALEGRLAGLPLC